MAKKKKKTDGKVIFGRVITVIFVLLLIGGGYYLYTLFKPIDINSQNIAGTWKVGSNPVTYYVFEMDENNDLMKGKATVYTQQEGSAEQKDKRKYKYEIITNDKGALEMHMRLINDRGRVDPNAKEEVIKLTGLSRAQLYVKLGRNELTSMVRVNLF